MNFRQNKTLIVAFLLIIPVAGYLTVEKYFNTSSSAHSTSDNLLGSVLQSPLMNNEEEVVSSLEEKSNKTLVLSQENILWYVNQNRSNHGLVPLKLNTDLNTSAHLKNADMVTYDYFEHTNPITGANFDTFFDMSNYSFVRIAENLAMGNFITSKEVVDAWMESPRHRKNILNPDFRDMGIDIAQGTIGAISTKLITQHFGTPRTSCPQVDSNLKKTIDGLRITTESLHDQIQIKKQKIGEYDNSPDGHISTQDYNQLIDDHNELVKKYNTYGDKLRTSVNLYNSMVQAIDDCIKGKG